MSNRLKKIIPFRFAVWAVIILNSVVIVFHLLVLLRIIPFEIVWAGKLKTVEEMYVFESISLIINCLIIVVVLIKAGIINLNISVKVINVFLWIIVVVFAMNTIGNLTAETSLETLIATPLTFILAILCLRLAIE